MHLLSTVSYPFLPILLIKELPHIFIVLPYKLYNEAESYPLLILM